MSKPIKPEIPPAPEPVLEVKPIEPVPPVKPEIKPQPTIIVDDCKQV